MNFDFEQSNNANFITQYFNKILNVIENFVAKRTRDVDKKKSIDFEYVFRSKISIQFIFNQNKSMKFFKFKRTKSNDNQKSNLLFENSTKLYETQNFDDSNLKINFQSKISIVKNFFIFFNQVIFRFFFVASINSRFISIFHDHFTKIVDEINDENRMKCNRCLNSYKYDIEFRNQINHLKVDHDIIIENKKKIKKIVYTIKIETTFNRQFELKKQRKSRLLNELQTQTIDKKMLEFLYMR